MKRKQAWGLTEACDWDEETHIGEDPTNEADKESNLKKFTDYVSRITYSVIRET